ncbi:isocitrate lyase/PEP mutase family protein [Sphingomonas flavalba]|uniref:isocitrate lyase/PEP mutase family protein n=1 Tax=Sphingomonas flavalba TaxID=2559804 RepID=UPI0039E0420A
MTDRIDRARAFAALHVPGKPVILFNVWDVGSAHAVAEAGAQALATGSWSVGAAYGATAAEAVPIADALANAARICAATPLPVTLDFEGGYATDPAALADNFGRAMATGMVGINYEDQVIGGSGIHPVVPHTARIAAMRAVDGDAFINARTDIFLKAPPEAHDAAALDAALERARAYADAGASGFFAPGLRDERLIARLCATAPLPVNIMIAPGVPDARRLAELGVARVSHGPGPYRLAMQAVTAAARSALG